MDDTCTEGVKRNGRVFLRANQGRFDREWLLHEYKKFVISQTLLLKSYLTESHTISYKYMSV